MLRSFRKSASRIFDSSQRSRDETRVPEDPPGSSSRTSWDENDRSSLQDRPLHVRSTPSPPPSYADIAGADVHCNNRPYSGNSAQELPMTRLRVAKVEATAPPSSVPRGYYKPMNPSLLEFDDLRSSVASSSAGSSMSSPEQPLEPNRGAASSLGVNSRNQASKSMRGEKASGLSSEDASKSASSSEHTHDLPTYLSFNEAPRAPYNAAQDTAPVQNFQSQPGETLKPSDPSSSTHVSNPYASAIQAQQDKMTISYLRTKGASTSASQSYDVASFSGFGQRYLKVEGLDSVMVTNQRRPAEVLSGTRECTICIETKAQEEFLASAISNACQHAPTICRGCVKASIKAQVEQRGFDTIRCPECNEVMDYADVEYFADANDRDRYQRHSIKQALGAHANFIQCAHGCDYWQIHEDTHEAPVFTCKQCKKLTCAHHKVPWHTNMGCDEYDQFLVDPENFRSRWELDEEAAESARITKLRQEEADRELAQSMLDREQRAIDEERLAAARRERAAREAREFREQMERRQKAEQMRQDMMRRKAEDRASERTVQYTTKRCPNQMCQAPIEKNDGCQHMTCRKCLTEFCWGCNGLWTRGHNNYCNGLV